MKALLALNMRETKCSKDTEEVVCLDSRFRGNDRAGVVFLALFVIPAKAGIQALFNITHI
ncbi:MAG: hypothetical protein HQK89_01535 [Nitrospirae bacterium]|nr:hypothetical protein [Nitrospirota bacterium]